MGLSKLFKGRLFLAFTLTLLLQSFFLVLATNGVASEHKLRFGLFDRCESFQLTIVPHYKPTYGKKDWSTTGSDLLWV